MGLCSEKNKSYHKLDKHFKVFFECILKMSTLKGKKIPAIPNAVRGKSRVKLHKKKVGNVIIVERKVNTVIHLSTELIWYFLC